jgi:hypothetical protein
VWVGRRKWISDIEWSKVLTELCSMTQHEMLVEGYIWMFRDVGSSVCAEISFELIEP